MKTTSKWSLDDDDPTGDLPTLTMAVDHGFSAAMLSDVGVRRDENQDRAIVLPHGVVVADGVGGSSGGGSAAQIAVTEMASFLSDALDEAGVNAGFRQAAEAADRAIRDHAELQGWVSSATTVVGAVLVASGTTDEHRHVVIGHVGDSRAMLWRGGELVRLTTDHSVEVDQGRGTRNVLTRCLGGGVNDHRPDLVTIRVQTGDVFLLCSDGLTNELTDEQIAMVLADGGDPTQVCRSLVDVALARGARDNVTVAVLGEGSRV